MNEESSPKLQVLACFRPETELRNSVASVSTSLTLNVLRECLISSLFEENVIFKYHPL